MIGDLAVSHGEKPEIPVSKEAQTLGRYLRLQATEFLGKNGAFFATFNRLDQPPSSNQFFHTAYPKVSPDFDNQHHVSQGIYMNHFFLGRWLPSQIQRMLFPWETQLPQGRRLTTEKMPTSLECHTCLKSHGVQQWAKSGDWFCLFKSRDDLFNSYGEYLHWKRDHDKHVRCLEDELMVCIDEEEASRLETEISILQSEPKSQNIPSKQIIPFQV